MSEVFLVRRGATAIPNKTVLDPDLSFQALGLLTIALAIPPGKPMGYRVFQDMGRGMGRDAILKALKSLSDLGYRWQFKARVEGQIRTFTVISDARISENDALAVIEAQGGYEYLVGCDNTGAKYQRQGKSPSPSTDLSRTPVEPNKDVSAGQAVRRVSGAQVPSRTPPVRRISVAQETSAPSRREVIDSSLRSESNSPDQTSAREGGRVGSGNQASDTGGFALLAQCLPAHMQTMDTEGAKRVQAILKQRVNAGWAPAEIRKLMDQELPPDTRRLSNLVAYRLKANVPSRPPTAPPPARARAVEPLVPPARQAWDLHVWQPLYDKHLSAHGPETPISTAHTRAGVETREELARRQLTSERWAGAFSEVCAAKTNQLDPENPSDLEQLAMLTLTLLTSRLGVSAHA